MAGFDVVIVGFRLNVKDRPATILERVLGMPAEEAKARTRVFPHVIADDVPRYAADTTSKLMQEAGARVEVRPHTPKPVLAPMAERGLTDLTLGRCSLVLTPEGRKSLVLAAPQVPAPVPAQPAPNGGADPRLAAKVSIYRLGDLEIPVQVVAKPERTAQAPRAALAPIAPTDAAVRAPLDVAAAAKALGVQVLPGTLDAGFPVPAGGRVLSDSVAPDLPRITIEHSALSPPRVVSGGRGRNRPSLVDRYRALEARQGWVGRVATTIRRTVPIVLSAAVVIGAVGGLKGWFGPVGVRSQDSAEGESALARMKASVKALNVPGVQPVQVDWPKDGVVDAQRVGCVLVADPTPEKLDALRAGRDEVQIPPPVLSQLHDHRETLRVAEGQPELAFEALCFTQL